MINMVKNKSFEVLENTKDTFLKDLIAYQELIIKLPKNNPIDFLFDNYVNNNRDILNMERKLLKEYSLFEEFYNYFDVDDFILYDALSSSSGSTSKYNNLEICIRSLYKITDDKILSFMNIKKDSKTIEMIKKIISNPNLYVSLIPEILKIIQL